MNATDFLHAVESRGLRPHKTGTGWEARCAGHDDRNASLSIAEGKDGRVLLKCHAGCSVESIVSALGLKMGDLFPAKEHRDRKPRIVTTYDYTDESGALIYQVVRFEPKDFRQRRPDPAKPGEWHWNLKATRRVLYRLPELCAAVATGRTIFVAEGEKDCDALAKAGFVATCNPMGAGKWQPELTDTLRHAARVVVLADKDKPGREHGQTVALALRGTVKSVKLIELPDVDGKAVKDTTDFLNAGGTANDLQTIVRTAPEFTPAQPDNTDKGEADAEVIARLAALPPLEYERQREAEAEKLNCRASVLDKEVAALRPKAASNAQGFAVDLPDVEPWPDAVDGAEVLREVAAVFCRYVFLPEGAADALALWTAHAHAFQAFLHTPRLNLRSAEKGCGKTTLLDVLGSLLPRAMRTESMTSAVLFRVIDRHQPVLLLDEVDAFLDENEELRGLLNAGHRRGARAYRVEGDGLEVRGFNAFAPAVLAGIGGLNGKLTTLHDRSVVVDLVRAKPGEIAERFDSRRTAHENKLCRKLARWTADNFDRLQNSDPVLPADAINRLADNWRCLFAIAEAAGSDWPRRAAAAFAKLTARDDIDGQGIGATLLADIAGIFATSKEDKLPSAKLAGELASIEGRPWAEFGKARKPISTNQLANQLRKFGISSRKIRVGDLTPWGYCLDGFREAFARFMPPTTPPDRNTGTRPVIIGDRELFDPEHSNSVFRPENATSANNGAGCAGVPAQKVEPATMNTKTHGEDPADNFPTGKKRGAAYV